MSEDPVERMRGVSVEMRWSRSARRTVRRGLLVALLASAACALTTSSASAAARLRDGDGLHVLAVKKLDSRLLEVTVSTAALPGPAGIRILLPPTYTAETPRRYPVLYLFHGTSGAAADWTVKGEAEKTTEGLPLIVVMPDIGLKVDGGGYCTNWVNGVNRWETFHIEELIPWIDANLRTIASRAGRGVAGLSQGGFCSLSYAARHPDLFSTALAFSGVPDIAYNASDTAGFTPIAYATETGLDGEPPNSMFGSRASNEINWADHDPTTLANNLRGMNLFEYFGNGEPGPGESPEPGAVSIEKLVHEDNIHFHERLAELAIPNFYDPYGAGTHSWPYWTRDLQWSIGPIMGDFAQPAVAPERVNYTIADQQYSVFGWTVTMHRTAEEFSTLEEASAQGFALAGSGSGTVVTARVFKRRKPYLVSMSGREGTSTQTIAADREGRLHIEVPLGPPNPYQQDTPEANAAGTAVYTTSVSIARARHHRGATP